MFVSLWCYDLSYSGFLLESVSICKELPPNVTGPVWKCYAPVGSLRDAWLSTRELERSVGAYHAGVWPSS